MGAYLNAMWISVTVHGFNLERFTALLEGICVTLNLHIQALKLYIYYYIDIYLKDVILTLANM